ncbi:MAG: hypothetical protein QW728_07175 [Thermoplasmata archaeon]
MNLRTYLKLVWLMMKEEYRFHTHFTSPLTFFLFPIMLITFGGGAVFALQRAGISMLSLSLSLHFGIFVYGLVTGSLGFMGKEIVERRFGQVAFLFGIPQFQPVSYKESFTAFFLRDVFFYIIYIVIPMVIGQLIFVPFTRLQPLDIVLLIFTVTASFSLGVSIAFLIAMVYLRTTSGFYAIIVVLSLLGIGLGVIRYRYLWILTGVLNFAHPLLVSLTISAVLLLAGALITLLSSALIAERQEGRISEYKNEYDKYYGYSRAFRSYAPLVAKEIIDLLRSRTISKIIFSFVLPLFILLGLTWLARMGLKVDIDFNTIFYGGMIGYFGVMIYSWINNMDVPDIYQTLPLSVPDVIRGRILIYHIINAVLGTTLVIFMGVIREEYALIPIALIVMFFTSAYIVAATAYLTGIRPNTLLFNIWITFKFNLFALVPLFLLTLLAMSLGKSPLLAYGGLAGMCIVLAGVTWMLYRSIDYKWKNAQFMM